MCKSSKSDKDAPNVHSVSANVRDRISIAGAASQDIATWVTAAATAVLALFAILQMQFVSELQRQEIERQRQQNTMELILSFSDPGIVEEVRQLHELNSERFPLNADRYEKIFEVSLAALKARQDAFVLCITTHACEVPLSLKFFCPRLQVFVNIERKARPLTQERDPWSGTLTQSVLNKCP